MARPALIVHGGAGTRSRDPEPATVAGCDSALREGWQVLERGGSALDAVVAAVVVLENDPVFNAGYGSVLTSAATVETDASLMAGGKLAAGACGAVRCVRNPILLARALLESEEHLFLVGDGAERFAGEHGVPLCAPEELISEGQRARWLEHSQPGSGGTVGAVAVDRQGHVAAATSTGGLFYKPPGRVGDSAVIGAGTYADDRLGAASATGVGEPILRFGLARVAVDLLRGGGEPQWAADEAVRAFADRTGSAAGVIVVDALGRLGHARNTERMPLAWCAEKWERKCSAC
jgi:beta-aspartyl-peptidase (threonine type)